MEEECKTGTARISLAHNSRVGASAARSQQVRQSSEGKWWWGGRVWVVVGEPAGAGVIYQQWPSHNSPQDELLSKPCF